MWCKLLRDSTVKEALGVSSPYMLIIRQLSVCSFPVW